MAAAPAPVLPPVAPGAPAAPGPAAPVPVVPAPVVPVAAGPNTPSQPASAAQYKILNDMVKINSQSVWSDQQDAHRFLVTLESILEFSPVDHSHWITLIFLMIPSHFELERTWVRNNIMTPLLSWNAAKAAFIAHFQRGDYMDGLRWLYNDCRQQPQETTQEYSRRFQTLATQLGYIDADVQSIYRFIGGLHVHVQQKMLAHKLSMRTVGNAPGWDFVSLSTTAQLAITMGTQHIYTPRPNTNTQPPLHLRHSALANPVSLASTATSSSSLSDSSGDTSSRLQARGSFTSRKRKDTSTSTDITSVEEKTCIYHPKSKGHSTDECKTKGKKQRNDTSTPSRSTSQSNTPSVAQQPQPPQRQPAPGKQSSVDLSQVECFRCHQHGHYANTCPTLPTSGNTQTNSNNNRGAPRSRSRGARTLKQIALDHHTDKKAVTFASSSQPTSTLKHSTTTETD